MIFMKESLPTIHAFKAEYPGSVDEIKIRHPPWHVFFTFVALSDVTFPSVPSLKLTWALEKMES